MITLKDIQLKPNEDEVYRCNHGYIDAPVKIFGQVRFDDGDQRLGLSVNKSIGPESFIDGLNNYLLWLAGCKDILEEFYKKENKYMLDEWYDGELDPEWYDTLEIYSGTIDINAAGLMGATFSCGDNMDTDHLLMIEIQDKQIKEMWFDG